LVFAMSIRRWVLSASVLSAMVAWMPQPAAAQGILARVKKLGGSTAAAGKKVVIDEANGEINSAVQDAAAEHVADGSFTAVLSPWAAGGVAKRVEVARFTGNAFVVTTPSGRQIMLCDDKSAQSWLASFAIQKKAPVNVAGGAAPGATAPTAGAPKNGGGAGAGGASKTHAAGSAPSGGDATGGAHGRAHAGGNSAHAGGAGSAAGDSSRSKSDSAGKSEPDPLSATRDVFSFPSNQVTVTLPATGAQSGKPSRGSLTVADVSQTILGGAGKIRFSQATIPGEKGPQVVDMGVTFKARVMAPGDAPVGCGTGTGSVKAAAGGRSPGGANPQTAPAIALPAGTAPMQGAGFSEGDVLLTKIGNVKLFAASNDSAKVTATVNVGDALVYLGQEENGYVHVQGAAGEGWVRKALLSKK
jgi:hypothetical protein